MRPISSRTVSGAALLAVCACIASGGRVAAERQLKSPTWARYVRATKTAHLRVIAGYTSADNGYNFNGGANGHFKFTVPVGSKVVVTFTNGSSMMPHGAEIVKYTRSLPTTTPPPPPAFSGAETPNGAHGEQPGVTVKFSFKAGKAGKYLLICPVHNHVKFGHWDWFIVSGKSTTASGVLKP